MKTGPSLTLYKKQLYLQTFLFLSLITVSLLFFVCGLFTDHLCYDHKVKHRFKRFEAKDTVKNEDTIKDEEIEDCKRFFNEQLEWYWSIKPDIISLNGEIQENSKSDNSLRCSETETSRLKMAKWAIERYFTLIKIAIRHGLINKSQIIDLKYNILPGKSYSGYKIQNIEILADFSKRLEQHIKRIKYSKRISKLPEDANFINERKVFRPYEYYSDLSSLPINYTSFLIQMPPLFNFGSVFIMTMSMIANAIFVVKKFIKNRK